MEEILATIRRIIAEDEQSSGTARRGTQAGTSPVGNAPADNAPPGIADRSSESTPREAARPSAEAAGATDILDLTDALDEDGSVRRLTPIGSVSSDPEPVSPYAEPVEVEAKPAEANPTADRPAPAGAGPEPDRAVDPDRSRMAARSSSANDERLVSDVAALAAATAFGRLASVPRTRREPPLVGGRPLDDIVRELLRPLLQTWLDENLPGIVERLVQAEIARISVRSGSG